MQPPIAGAASPQTPMTDALAQGLQVPGAAQDGQTGALVQVMGQIREVNDQIQALGTDFPTIAPLTTQIQQLLKQAVIQLASQAPAQTASGAAVPMGGAAA